MLVVVLVMVVVVVVVVMVAVAVVLLDDELVIRITGSCQSTMRASRSMGITTSS